MKKKNEKQVLSRRFGEVMQQTRTHLGLNQVGVAASLGTSQSKVSKMEDDRLEPSASELCWVVQEVLGLDLREELSDALAPARQEMARRERLRAHRRGEHNEQAEEACSLCQSKIRGLPCAF